MKCVLLFVRCQIDGKKRECGFLVIPNYLIVMYIFHLFRVFLGYKIEVGI